MKKYLLLLLLFLFPVTFYAYSGEATVNGIKYYVITKTNTAKVIYSNYSGNIDIPSSINYEGVTCNVTTIGSYAFNDCPILSITIPNSVTIIEDYAFYRCGFSSVTIPEGVEEIGNKAFLACSSLSSISIPSSVKRIGDWAFQNCYNLKRVNISNLSSWYDIDFSFHLSNPLEIAHHLYMNDQEITHLEIPDNVIRIKGATFFGCEGLLSISIPNSVKEIGDYAFAGSGITSLVIPDDISTIGRGAFQHCKGLKSIIMSNNITAINSSTFSGCSSLESLILPNSLTIIDDNAFSECSNLKTLTIPNSITSIGKYAFYNCTGLSNLVIGKGITLIKDYAFANCSNISDVYIYANKSPVSENEIFSNSYINYSTLHVPNSAIDLYKESEPWKKFKEIIKINLPKHKLTYIVDNIEYKTFDVEEEEIISPEEEPTKKGHEFSGWSEIPKTMPAYDVTVTGSFTINTYKLIYVVDGKEYKSYEVEYGTSITPEAAPTNEGYTFGGWSEIPEIMPAHDVTVAGSFTINKYTLTYKVDGAEYKTAEVEYGADITAETAPTKEGYTFSGWSEIPATMPAKDVTVTGGFTVNKYALTYKVDGAEYKTAEVEYGADITAETAPTKEGYTFSGWSEIPETMPANDVTVTGIFSINSYKLTYMIDDKVYKEDMYEYSATITPEPQPEGDYQAFEWTDLPQTMPAHDVVVHASYTSEIIDILMTKQRNVRIYSLNGEEFDKLQKGINIVILDDGTVKKIVVK